MSDAKLEPVVPPDGPVPEPAEPNPPQQVELHISEFALSREQTAYVLELRTQMAILDAQINSALTMIVRQNKLQGNWGISPDATKLIQNKVKSE